LNTPSEASARITALRKIPFLTGLDPRSLEELAKECQIVRAEKGEDLFLEGDPCRGMFLLLSGSLKVFRSVPSGRQQILAIESPGALVAELPLLDGGSYPASCAAMEESRLLLLPADVFEDLLRRHPEIALGTLRVVGRRLRHLVMLVEELSLLEVPQRLAKYLLSTSRRLGPTFTLTLSNQELASRLGTVREIVSRALHRLQDEGLIKISGREIEIVDAKGLRSKVEEG
jgi:CRP/FNR family transcriptional regulator